MWNPSEHTIVLAMGFATPAILWGLVLGTLPILIHLLYRRQYRETDWAAMQFLINAAQKTSRRHRLEKLLLLFVRCLILVLLVSALAEPYLNATSGQSSSGKPTQHLLVVDASMSMQHKVGAESRIEHARNVARQIVDRSQQGDAFNLITLADASTEIVIKQPTFERETVAAAVARIRATEEPARLVQTLQHVVELLDTTSASEIRVVSIISDFQKSTWHPPQAANRAALSELFDTIGGRAQLRLFNVGDGQSANHAITNVKTADAFNIVGAATRVSATVRNFSSDPVTDQTLEIIVDDRSLETIPFDIPANAETDIEFQVDAVEAGQRIIEVKTGSDQLESDDRRFLVVDVRREIDVLLVDGQPGGRPTERATHYLETVLEPDTQIRPWNGLMRTTVVNAGELANTDISPFQCVILSNVGLLTRDEVVLLRNFVSRGGGLIVFLGDQIRPDNYNQTLFHPQTGVLPVRLVERIGNARSPIDAYRFSAANLRHPIVQQFEGNPDTGLLSTMILEYFRIRPLPDTSPDVVLRYNNEDIAIAAQRLGQGKCLLVTTSVDNKWGPWPIQRSFPPIIHESVRFVVSNQRLRDTIHVGDPLDYRVPAQAFDAPVRVTRPDGRQDQLSAVTVDQSRVASYGKTNQSGVYRLDLESSSSRAEHFAVNVDVSESDLTTVGEPDLQAGVLTATDFAYFENWQSRNPAAATLAGVRAPMVRWTLFAVLGLIFVEQIMAWKFVYGVCLLFTVVAAVSVTAAGFYSLRLGWSVAVCFAILSIVLVWMFRKQLIFRHRDVQYQSRGDRITRFSDKRRVRQR